MSYGHTVSANGGAALETSNVQFGTAALDCPGASSYASTSNASHFLDFGSGDFTVEGWGYLASLSGSSHSHFRRMSQQREHGPYQIKVQVGTGNIGFSIGGYDE